MAYGKRYESDYKSSNGDSYTLEIFCEGWTSASTEIKLGSSGCVINYETNGELKFSYILASSMEVPFIIEDIGMQNFIDDLRDGTYSEKDVYVHLYNSHDSTRPVWSGYILMDLSAKQDISFPYEVKLTAVDGLALLRDKPFVRETNTSTSLPVEFPYDLEDVWYNEYTTFRYWLERILVKTGSALLNEGSSSNYTYQTSVNWYNSEHPGTSQTDDPLALTQCKMNSMYERDENLNYTPKSTYEVLEAICKSWGMRCVYWNHTFHFVQIAEYLTAETGTPAAPINIPTREYYYTGGLRDTSAYIGTTELSRYELELENITDPGYGLQKLAGSQYDYYAPIKKIIGNFNIFADGNHFNGFPPLDQTTSTTNPIIYSSPIDTLTDAANSAGWFCQIPLNFTNINSKKLILGSTQTGFTNPRIVDMQVAFSIRAKQTGAGSWSKMLVDIGGVLSWVTYDDTTPVDYLRSTQTNIPIGSSQRIIFDSTNYQDGVIPTDAAFTGDWDFEFFTFTNGLNSNRTSYHGTITANSNGQYLARAGTSATTFDYSNVFNSNNQFIGIFAETTGGYIRSNSIRNEITTSTSDSYTLEINDLFWGDSALTDIGSTLKVWNGSDFVNTSDVGLWGVGTLTGTDSFVNLLAKEIMGCQSFSSLKMNATSALSETNKDNSGKPKYINPVGRILDLDNRKYVMLRSTFTTGNDEWNGDWFESTYTLPAVTIANSYAAGDTSGPVTGGGNQGGLIGQGAQPNMQPWGATTTSTRLASGSITSIPIDAIQKAIFKTGDNIFVTDNGSGQRISFVINADQGASDTSLTVVAKTIDFDLRVGSIIGINNENLIQQYQRKTEGEVAGFDIDADGIAKGGVEITGWLDRDDMVGATANNVPTAESVKAYVDGETHANNFSALTCSTTSLSSATAGAANAVVCKYDTETASSDTDTIIVYGATGVPDITGGEYSFSVTPAEFPDKTAFEFSWNISFNTSVVNNRILLGTKLQQGVDSGGAMVWSDVPPTHSYAYNRGTGSIRYGTTSNGMFIVIEGAQPIQFFRLVFWKENSSHASTKGITEINGTNFRIKQIN